MTRPKPQCIALLVFLLGLVAGLSACSIHRIDIQQGNVITQEVLEKLMLGMEKEQVRHLLGTSLIEDPFHKDRWDYIYRYQAGNTDEHQSAHLSLQFSDGRLSAIDVRETPPKEADVKKPGLRSNGQPATDGAVAQPHSH
jgi:outer membrane protein assembly factor BamE